MAGRFYPVAELMADRRYLLSTGLSLLICGASASIVTRYLFQRATGFDRIAQVRLETSGSSTLTNVSPLSSIDRKNNIGGSSFVGYFEPIRVACEKAESKKETMILLVVPGGKTTLGTTIIDEKSCSILKSIDGRTGHIYAASDEASKPSAKREIVTIAEQPAAIN